MGDFGETYRLKLVYDELWKVLEGVDPERYSMVVLKSDFTEVFMGDAEAWKKYEILFSYVPLGKVRSKVVLVTDDDLMRMFSLNKGQPIVVLHCEVKENGIVITPGHQGANVAVTKGKKKRTRRKISDTTETSKNGMRTRKTQISEGRVIEGDLQMEDEDDSDESYNDEDEDDEDEEEQCYVLSVKDNWKNYYNEDGDEIEVGDGVDLVSDTECDFEKELDNELYYHPLRKCLNREQFQFREREKISIRVGMLFPTQKDVKAAVIDYAIQEGFQTEYIKSEATRVTMCCKAEKCTWRMRSSRLPDGFTFSIKTMTDEHTCRLDQRIVSPLSWIVKQILSTVKADRKVSMKVMRSVLLQYGVRPGRHQMMRARDKALDMIDGNHGEAFKLMPQYCIEVVKSNPGSLGKIEYCTTIGEDIPWVRRVFIGFDAVKKGFLDGCRPYIGFDGCHINGRYGGVLLSAIANDPDGGFFPFAVAYVEGECKESWSFFLNMVKEFLGSFHENRPWMFMTDRQKGLKEAIEEIFPRGTQRKCSRHIYANFRQSHPSVVFKKLFWNASMAYTGRDFDVAMDSIKDLSVEAYDYLAKLDKILWVRHSFSTSLKCANVTNNPSKSFNNWLDHIRNLSILSMLEELRCKVMCRLNTRYETSLDWSTKVCPRTAETLRIVTKQGRRLQFFQSSATTFEVTQGQQRFALWLDKWSCQCGVWDHTGIPCKHATAVLISKGLPLEDYCDPMLTKEKFQKAYSHMIAPVPHKSFWEPSNLPPCNPPKLKRRIGRPKTKRVKEDWENEGIKRSSTHKCTICGEYGHNRLTCVGGLTAKEKKSRKRKVAHAENRGVDSGSATENIKGKRGRKTKAPKQAPDSNNVGNSHVTKKFDEAQDYHEVPITLGDIPAIPERDLAMPLGEQTQILSSGSGTRRKKLVTNRYQKKPLHTQPLFDTTIDRVLDITVPNMKYAARTSIEKETDILEENYESTPELPSSNFVTTQEESSQPNNKPVWESNQFTCPDDIQLDFEGLVVQAVDRKSKGKASTQD